MLQAFEHKRDWIAAGPLFEGSAEDITKDLDANLVDCDTLLLVYGKADAPWIRAQLRRYSKIERLRGEPPRVKTILFAPPAPKPEIAMSRRIRQDRLPARADGGQRRENCRGAPAVTDDMSQRAPYPGLRAFRREETDLFFGREDCINAMVDRLAATRFLAVLGSSGTGKSSLVRTGLLDALELGLMAKAGSRWKIVDFRPGGPPLKNLARRLLETEERRRDPTSRRRTSTCCGPISRAGRAPSSNGAAPGICPRAPTCCCWSTSSRNCSATRTMPAARRPKPSSRCCLKARARRTSRIYVTITMRSEYLGACALIEGLADAINAGMFLTPRMTREECRDAISGPAAVCDIDIEPALVNRLLNDLANFAPWDRSGRQRPARPADAARRPASADAIHAQPHVAAGARTRRQARQR